MSTTTTETDRTACDEMRQLIDNLERTSWETSTPEADAIRAAMPTEAFTVRGGATFGPDEHRPRLSVHVAADGQTWDGSVRGVTVKIYGAMTYKDRRDGAARVEVRTALVDGVWRIWSAYTHATAWNGKTHADLPEGARQAIADHLAVIVQALHIDVPTLIAEHQFAQRCARRDRAIGEALRALETAVNA